MLTIMDGNELIVTHLSNTGDQTNEFRLTNEIIDQLLGEKK